MKKMMVAITLCFVGIMGCSATAERDFDLPSKNNNLNLLPIEESISRDPLLTSSTMTQDIEQSSSKAYDFEQPIENADGLWQMSGTSAHLSVTHESMKLTTVLNSDELIIFMEVKRQPEGGSIIEVKDVVWGDDLFSQRPVRSQKALPITIGDKYLGVFQGRDFVLKGLNTTREFRFTSKQTISFARK